MRLYRRFDKWRAQKTDGRGMSRVMFILIRAIIWTLILLKRGDWRNWKQYQSSILYVIATDFLYNFLCYHYSMWEYAPNLIFSTHTATTLFYAITIHPCVVILYLNNYPNGKRRQVAWVLFWIMIYAVIEWIELKMGILVYHHGWSILWSCALMSAALLLIRTHQHKPLWAYGASIAITALLVLLFHVPISK